MTLFVPSGGKRLRFKAIVMNATPVELITVSDKSFVYTVESISVRLIGADRAFDFSVDDGDDDICFAGQETTGADKYWKQDSHHITVEHGETLNFTAGGATEMHVTVVALETDTSGR